MIDELWDSTIGEFGVGEVCEVGCEGCGEGDLNICSGIVCGKDIVCTDENCVWVMFFNRRVFGL